MSRPFPVAAIAGQQLDLGALGDIAAFLAQSEKPLRFSYTVTANLAHLEMLRRDKEFAHAYDEAELRLVDGMPVAWLLRRSGAKGAQRTAGSDVLPAVLELLSRRGSTIGIIAGVPGSERRIEHGVLTRYPGLERCAVLCPPADFSPTAQEGRSLASRAAREFADVDFVALCFGAPKQEEFARAWAHILPGVRGLCCGAALLMLIGDVTRAPIWLQRLGLEWFYRLLSEPRRLTTRYLRCGAYFGVLCIRMLVRA